MQTRLERGNSIPELYGISWAFIALRHFTVNDLTYCHSVSHCMGHQHRPNPCKSVRIKVEVNDCRSSGPNLRLRVRYEERNTVAIVVP